MGTRTDFETAGWRKPVIDLAARADEIGKQVADKVISATRSRSGAKPRLLEIRAALNRAMPEIKQLSNQKGAHKFLRGVASAAVCARINEFIRGEYAQRRL
jgi:hypothetical protein